MSNFIVQVSNRCLCRYQYLIGDNDPAPLNSAHNALLIAGYSLLHTTAMAAGYTAIDLCAGDSLKTILGENKIVAVTLLSLVLYSKVSNPILQKFEFTKEEQVSVSNAKLPGCPIQ